jgi:hypothetical protein
VSGQGIGVRPRWITSLCINYRAESRFVSMMTEMDGATNTGVRSFNPEYEGGWSVFRDLRRGS